MTSAHDMPYDIVMAGPVFLNGAHVPRRMSPLSYDGVYWWHPGSRFSRFAEDGSGPSHALHYERMERR